MVDKTTIEKIVTEIVRILDDEKMTSEEAAAYLGVSRMALSVMVSSREIPYYRPSPKKVYFKKSELEKYLFNPNNRFKSKDEIEEMAQTRVLRACNE